MEGDLLGFGPRLDSAAANSTAVPPPQPQTQEAPLVDLFGAPQLLPSSPNNPITPNTTQNAQPQSQAPDLFGAPIPSATPPPLPIAATNVVASTPIGETFAPDAASASASAPPMAATTDDPFAVFLQPQVQPHSPPQSDPAAFPAPLSTVQGSPPLPAQSEQEPSKTIAPAYVAEATNPTGSLPLPAQPAAATPTEFETPQRTTTVVKNGEEEKKDQDSPSVPVASAKQLEGTETAVAGSSVSSDKPATPVKEIESDGSIPVPNSNDVGKGSSESATENEYTPPLVSSTNNISAAAPETPAPGISESTPVAPTSDETSEGKAEAEKVNQVQNAAEKASRTTSMATTAVAVTFEGTKQPKPATTSNLLSTLTKSPKTNRFSGFKSMAGNIAAKGAERVAKVKDQIQKEDDGQNANANANANANNRFAGFKNIAGTMAAKGAERVAKVKDQIQKEDTDGNRFAGFKSMAGTMAAKGAERVAKVKDQIQKEDTDGQNINAKRLAGGFKSITGKIAAKSAERVAKVKDQIQHSSHGLKTTSSHGLINSSHGLKTVVAAKATPSPASSVSATKSSPQIPTATIEATDIYLPNNPSTLPSTPITITHDTPRDSEGFTPIKEVPPPKEPVATDTGTSEANNTNGETEINVTVEPERPKNNEESSLPPQAQDISSISQQNNSTETNANTNVNDLAESIDSTKSAAQKSSNVDVPKSDGTKSPETAVRVEADKSGEESISVPPQRPATVVNDIMPPNEDSSVKSKPEKTEETASSSKKMEAGSAKSTDSNKAIQTPNSSSPKINIKTSSSEPTSSTLTTEIENPTDTNPVETSNKPQPQETPSKTLQSSLPTQGTSDQVEVLRKELHAAHTLIMQLQHHENVEEERPGDAVMVELQANLQKEMTRRAEAEEKARVTIAKSKRIEEEYVTFKKVSKASLFKMTSSVDSLQANLQKETSRRSEAEEKARLALAKSKQIEEEYTTFKTVSKANLNKMTSSVEILTREKNAMETEVVEIREERDEQARKEMALTTRLNAAKKKEAVKANAAEHYGDQVDQLEFAVKEYGSQVESLTAERDQLKVELGEWKEYAEKRTKQLETALNDEKKLNDERKRKMKGFVEAKTEEVRSAKADYISLQTEMDQNSHSLTELNQRYKQLHAQWVQSQTRNRELQRDSMKMKKDSEKMHKVGGSLEARLSRSAQESEDHKNKRIHARNELMSVLAQLEAERSVNSRLQESIKMTFTPKALSQQQTIHEAMDDFEGALQKLSTRIGRPLPPTFSNDPNAFSDKDSLVGGSSELQDSENDDTIDNDESSNQGTVTLSEINTNRAVQKLENETQRVSQNIMKFSASIERMHSLLDGGGTKNCVDVLSQMLMMSGNATPAIAAGSPRRKSSGSQRYGQISSSTR